MRGAPLGDDDVAGLLDDGDAVRVEQLPVSLPALAKLELEAALAVEDLVEARWRCFEDQIVLIQYCPLTVTFRLSVTDISL